MLILHKSDKISNHFCCQCN